ncbi:MAG: DegV family protein [Anaerorhabdus sp.]
MIRLITDTSSLYTPAEARELGFIVNPLSVTIGGKSYLEYVEINDKEFLELIQKGTDFPSSSQPSVGMVLESIESIPAEDDIIYLCLADGLSGTYQTALSAVSQLPEDRQKKIHVINSKTLCGPHRYLVQLILKWITEDKTITDILALVEKKLATAKSFLLPSDFGFLKRGGRCTPLAATIGGVLKLQPVVMQTPDGKRLDKFITGRSFDIAVNKILSTLNENNGLHNMRVYISHAFAKDLATKVKDKITSLYPQQVIEIVELSCAFITQGGPRCLAIQIIEN